MYEVIYFRVPSLKILVQAKNKSRAVLLKVFVDAIELYYSQWFQQS